MTFSSASVSDCEVDEVAATAAGATGLRAGAGGKAACWRVAGAMAAAAGAAAVFLAAGFGAGAEFLAAVWGTELVGAGVVGAGVLGTTLRAIGRGLGMGTFGLAQASAANADNPTASASVTSALVPKAVRRNVGGGTNGVTAFLRGESIKR